MNLYTKKHQRRLEAAVILAAKKWHQAWNTLNFSEGRTEKLNQAVKRLIEFEGGKKK